MDGEDAIFNAFYGFFSVTHIIIFQRIPKSKIDNNPQYSNDDVAYFIVNGICQQFVRKIR